MEFGAVSRIDSGKNVVGVSWTSSSADTEANTLVTTTESRVAVYSAEDRSLLSSWITRPGSYNKFSTAAVQNRVLRKFFCVQNGNRLFSWHEDEASLETATKRKLPTDVYALRTSKRLRLTCIVYNDGGVSFVDESLADIASMPGQADGMITTWARLTKTPGDDSRFFLLLLRQPEGVIPGSGITPYLQVYILSVKAAADGSNVYSLKLAATHQLSKPSEANVNAKQSKRAETKQPALTISTVTLHKIARSVCLLWSNGLMQTLQFPLTTGVWYTHTPKEIFTRHLGRFFPDATTESAPLAVAPNSVSAAFALEPSCMVLAGEGESSAIGLSVWDIRYGIVLAVQKVDMELQSAASAAGDDSVATGETSSRRKRTLSTAGESDGEGKLTKSRSGSVSAAKDATSAAFLQVLVSEDNSYVAVASRRRIILVDVAARGASLVSAIGRMDQTREFLAAAEHSNVVDATKTANAGLLPHLMPAKVCVGPVIPLSKCLQNATLKGLLSAPLSTSWEASISTARAEALQACTDTLQASSDDLLKRIVSMSSATEAHLHPAMPPAKRARTSSTASEDATRKRPLRVAVTLPAGVAECAVLRCAAEVKRCLAGETAAFDVSKVMQQLLDAGCLTAAIAAPVLHALLEAGSAKSSVFKTTTTATKPPASGKKRGRKSMAPDVEADEQASVATSWNALSLLQLLAHLVTRLADIPEMFLVQLFSAGLHRIPGTRLGKLWTLMSATKQPIADALPGEIAGLLHWTALIVSSPRNDVFLEQALATMHVDDAAMLLSCLLRLVELHAAGPADPYFSVVGRCTYAQVLDWVRMTFDAHFARFILAAKSDSQSSQSDKPALRGILQDFVRLTKAETAMCEASAAIRAQILHLLGGGPLPLPPPPDHIVEFLPL